MRKLIFEFEEPLSMKLCYAYSIEEKKFIKLLGFASTGSAHFTGFECPEDKLEEAMKLFKKHKINFKKLCIMKL